MIFLLACTTPSDSDSPSVDTGTPASVVTDYEVVWSTDPSPLEAGQAGAFTLQVLDQDGAPLPDLQENHDRMVHTTIISADWSTFVHTNHEDHGALTEAALQSATFSFPLSLPSAGRHRLLFSFAHQDQWLDRTGELVVEGSPAQAASPDTTPTSEVLVDDLVVRLSWGVAPQAGEQASWTISIAEVDGTPVEDLVQYLGADAHCALVDSTLSWSGHTHAWFPDMEALGPGMEVPHLFTGPDLPFVYFFPNAGPHKMWVEFTRDGAPGVVYTAPFVFEVAA